MKPSRAMIPGELFAAYVALAYAWAGAGGWPMTPGPIAHLVAAHANPVLWLALLGAPALLLIGVSGGEWFAHRRACADCTLRWSFDELARSALVRGRLCLALICGWLYLAKLTLQIPSGASAASLVAAGGVAFCVWFYVENRRVQREIRAYREPRIRTAG